MFEDLGVSVYDDAGSLLTSAEHMAAIGTGRGKTVFAH
jgi:hypothetical protein